MSSSAIEWTERTWNPVTGCIKVSAGCKNCYAEAMSKRLQAMGKDKYADAFKPRLHYELIRQPSSWRKPALIFVCSMSDLFQEYVPFSFIKHVCKEMHFCPKHRFQVLTKRAARMRQYFTRPDRTQPPNCWLGVSVENQANMDRALELAAIPEGIHFIHGKPPVRFLSVEPMLGPVNDFPEGINWIICGGESGPGARPVDPRWVRSLRDECRDRGVPFFFKQWGGKNKKRAGRELDGRTWDEMPEGR